MGLRQVDGNEQMPDQASAAHPAPSLDPVAPVAEAAPPVSAAANPASIMRRRMAAARTLVEVVTAVIAKPGTDSRPEETRGAAGEILREIDAKTEAIVSACPELDSSYHRSLLSGMVGKMLSTQWQANGNLDLQGWEQIFPALFDVGSAKSLEPYFAKYDEPRYYAPANAGESIQSLKMSAANAGVSLMGEICRFSFLAPRDEVYGKLIEAVWMLSEKHLPGMAGSAEVVGSLSGATLTSLTQNLMDKAARVLCSEYRMEANNAMDKLLAASERGNAQYMEAKKQLIASSGLVLEGVIKRADRSMQLLVGSVSAYVERQQAREADTDAPGQHRGVH